MDKLIISLDISLNSTGVCFRYCGKSRFLNIASKYCFTSSLQKTKEEIMETNPILSSLDGVMSLDIILIDRQSVKKAESFTINQRILISNAMKYSSIVVNAIREIRNSEYRNVDSSNIEVAFESISFGSVGDNTVQLIEITTLIKEKLVKYILDGNVDNYTSLPGPSIKAFIGHGTFCKFKIFERFLSNFHKDTIESNDLFTTLHVNPDIYKKGTYKPLKIGKSGVVDDICLVNGVHIGKVVSKKTAKKDKEKITLYQVLLHDGQMSEIEGKGLEIQTPDIDIKTPISDIIDAYFIALYMERVVLVNP